MNGVNDARLRVLGAALEAERERRAGQAAPAPSPSTVNVLVGVDGGRPDHGVSELVVCGRAAAQRRGEHRPRPVVEAQLEVRERQLRVVGEGRPELARRRVGRHLPSSFTDTPKPATTTKMRYGLSASWRPMKIPPVIGAAAACAR